MLTATEVKDTVIAIAPEFTGQDARVEIFAGFVLGDVDGFPEVKQKEAAAYLTAHKLTVSDRGGSSGSLTSKTEGNLSVGFSAPDSKDNALLSTSYGAEYDRLVRLYFMGAMTSYGQNKG